MGGGNGGTRQETLSGGQTDGGHKDGRGNRIPRSKKATLHRETGVIPVFNPCLRLHCSSARHSVNNLQHRCTILDNSRVSVLLGVVFDHLFNSHRMINSSASDGSSVPCAVNLSTLTLREHSEKKTTLDVILPLLHICHWLVTPSLLTLTGLVMGWNTLDDPAIDNALLRTHAGMPCTYCFPRINFSFFFDATMTVLIISNIASISARQSSTNPTLPPDVTLNTIGDHMDLRMHQIRK